MKKELIIIILIILMLFSTMGSVCAKTVFLTSDNIIGQDADVEMLNSIKNYIEEMSNGELQVIVDSESPSPGEGTRAIESNCDVSVNIAAACAGNLLILAKYSVNAQKQIIFVNTGNFDLSQADSLRRAWDDDYSSTGFAGINSPGQFLNDAGISYIQPLQVYPDAGPNGYLNEYNEDVNRYIAQEIINCINNYDNSSNTLDTNLIITHSLPPSSMAEGAQELLESGDSSMNGTYNSYTAPQLLYLMSSYLNGNGLQSPQNYEAPENPQEYSIFPKDSYSISEYMEMAGIIKNYMDEHGQAPNYIEYEGARLSYYDIIYNFAIITENHTSGEHMDFAREYHFEKVNENILLTIFPFVLVIVVVMLLCVGIRKIKRK